MTQPNKTSEKDVPLGPACLVFFMFGAVLLSVGLIYMSSQLMGSQGKLAARAVREEIIPWVEQSSLSEPDQRSILERLNELSASMEREELTSRQLGRLALRLTECPILQWGVVEQIQRIAEASPGMAKREKEDFANECDRWLRAASEGKLSMQQMEFALQNVAVKEVKSGRLSAREKVTDEQLREFLQRMGTINDSLQIEKGPFDKSVSQVFRAMIADGLAEK